MKKIPTLFEREFKTIELSEYCQISALTLLGSWPATA